MAICRPRAICSTVNVNVPYPFVWSTIDHASCPASVTEANIAVRRTVNLNTVGGPKHRYIPAAARALNGVAEIAVGDGAYPNFVGPADLFGVD